MGRLGKRGLGGDALVAVLADDEAAVLLATLVHQRRVLFLGHLREKGGVGRGWECDAR